MADQRMKEVYLQKYILPNINDFIYAYNLSRYRYQLLSKSYEQLESDWKKYKASIPNNYLKMTGRPMRRKGH